MGSHKDTKMAVPGGEAALPNGRLDGSQGLRREKDLFVSSCEPHTPEVAANPNLARAHRAPIEPGPTKAETVRKNPKWRE